MTQDGAAPHPLTRQDAVALVGVTAVLEGELMIGEMEPHLVGSLNRHLRNAGLVEPGAGAAELRLALADLSQRMRYVLGEYAEPPVPRTEVDQLFGFESQAAALSFTGSARAAGEEAGPPKTVDVRAYDGRAYDGRVYDGDVTWQVAVRTAELPLSVDFDRHQDRLRALAAEHGGVHGGWCATG